MELHPSILAEYDFEAITTQMFKYSILNLAIFILKKIKPRNRKRIEFGRRDCANLRATSHVVRIQHA